MKNLEKFIIEKKLCSICMASIIIVILFGFYPVAFAAPSWTIAGDMSIDRRHATVTQLNTGKILVVGGIDSTGNYISSAELYNPVTNEFELAGAIPDDSEAITHYPYYPDIATQPSGLDADTINSGARNLHTATLLLDGTVLIAGGYAGTGGPSYGLFTAFIYDPALNTFTQTTDKRSGEATFGDSTYMKYGRGQHEATLLQDGRVLLSGGYGHVYTRTEIYDPVTGLFTETAQMSMPRHKHTATLLNNGNVLIAGGVTRPNPDNYTETVTTSVEIYNPGTDSFTSTGSMSDPRSCFTASLLPDNRVLVTGGSQGTMPLKTTEIYDAGTGTFFTSGSLALDAGRQWHAAIAHDGGVYVIGGNADNSSHWNNLNNYLDSVEFFDPTGGMAGTGDFITMPSMLSNRSMVQAAVTPYGILVPGGGVITAELFAEDTDSDLYADAHDNCPANSNGGQEDLDGDGIGDSCDDDTDGDGLGNVDDSAPLVADADSDGYNDGVEVAAGTNPSDGGNYPLYNADDFYANIIDWNIWSDSEFVRRIKQEAPNNRVLESIITRYGSSGSNYLGFVSPNGITSIQADVNVTETINDSAELRAGVGGYFYNAVFPPGDIGNGRTGDVYAQVGIRNTGTELKGFWFTFLCENADCTSGNLFGGGEPSDWIVDGTERVSISWDGTQFIFTFAGGADVVYDPTSVVSIADPLPKFQWKEISTRVTGTDGNPARGGTIAAEFDNIAVNGTLYDTFENSMIDPLKWTDWEFVRKADAHMLESVIARYSMPGSNTLQFINPDAVTAFQADISVDSFNSDNSFPMARIGGFFYNDGTPGSGATGDIYAGVHIMYNGVSLVPVYQIRRCGEDCNYDSESIVYQEIGSIPVNLGEAYRAAIKWDGANHEFTFKFEGDQVTIPTDGPISPYSIYTNPSFSFKGIGTRIGGNPIGWGYINAILDNVVVLEEDSDLDGLPDWDEVNIHFTDPHDRDSDNDGVSDGAEVVIHGTNANSGVDTDNDGIPDDWETANGLDPGDDDTDGDGVVDGDDVFPNDINDWADYDGDNIGDNSDICPYDSNPVSSWTDINGVLHSDAQPDFDLDGIGDVCDPDADDDGYISPYFPNGNDCNDLDPSVYPGTSDCLEGISTAPKVPKVPEVPNTDGDDFPDNVDFCPNTHSVDNLDFDEDGVGDVCDSCPLVSNPGQKIPVWYKDLDGDFYSDGTTVEQCDCPAGYRPYEELSGVNDCNDGNEFVHPGAVDDVTNEGVDNDCNLNTPDTIPAYYISYELTGYDGSNYDTWIPEDGKKADILFKVMGPGLTEIPSSFSFHSLEEDVSRHPGKYTNDDTEEGLPEPSADFAEPYYNGNLVTLEALDFGGSIIIHAEVTIVVNGGTLTLKKDVRFPKDSDKDGMADKWEIDNKLDYLTPDSAQDPDNDGLTNFQEYRAVKWGSMTEDPGSTDPYITPYYTPAHIPTGLASPMRMDPNRRSLFVQYSGFDATSYPFAVGTAFFNARIDLYALSDSLSISDQNIDVLKISLKDDEGSTPNINEGTFGYESGHIIKRGIRDFTFATLGMSNFGDVDSYGLSCDIYKVAIDSYFNDRPYADGTTLKEGTTLDDPEWDPIANKILDIITRVEDKDDDGIIDKKEDPNETGLDGDYLIPEGVTWDFDKDFSPFDIDTRTVDIDPTLGPLVELPVGDTSIQYTKAQVLKHVVTHEIGHNVGITFHTQDPTCVMYEYSNNWNRDYHFSDIAKDLIKIHNQN